MITRRSLLKLMAGAAAAGFVVPALQSTRSPYVLAGEVASYIGHCPGGFIGGQVVHQVLPWDGVGYPMQVWNNAFGVHRALETYYDVDLANFNREIPRNFWHNHSTLDYPNVHTWLRMQRYGETRAEAIRALNFVGIRA
ncbi:hypothetical protein NA655_08480 [Pseudomonas kuykendallii]|uniref:Tat (Twin-arginine translocation) pathway signal sequence n=1 Tax=Pseudomonas kuykendallii TaxID=1007099 RepID=A0A1H3EKM1_9PSED|nr:hypothetical protein [Pseudomonas kuykendallii]MCQ4271055.1 hypothetical protein [Pseudomonas kuykendallii]SDX79322.1 hypothetical protein SAMN05216287_3767 [Pseudomonas kuykendallii]